MFHYVRDVQHTRFSRLHALPIGEFRDQVRQLAAAYEMATIESALAFLDNAYTPVRDLCLLTFDDGLREHYDTVLPILVEEGIQGLFFVVTSCFGGRVASVHKNHFVMALLTEAEYEHAVLTRAAVVAPDCSVEVDPFVVRQTYRWDTPATARIKYLVNFQLPEAARGRLIDDLFAAHCGDETAFANGLYVTWEQAREMQRAGMVIGGHSHTHAALGTLDADRQRDEVATCAGLLRWHLRPQAFWPFSYPYGKPGAYNESTVDALRAVDFSTAFTTTVGTNAVGQNRYGLLRVDTKDVRV
jgi:peptidoglycan/xylan/chitin deacetylase (PgdA/CDA1 family)